MRSELIVSCYCFPLDEVPLLQIPLKPTEARHGDKIGIVACIFVAAAVIAVVIYDIPNLKRSWRLIRRNAALIYEEYWVHRNDPIDDDDDD
jgi:hypothetical protein